MRFECEECAAQEMEERREEIAVNHSLGVCLHVMVMVIPVVTC